MIVIGHEVYGLGWSHLDVPELAVFTLAGVIAFGSLGIAMSHAIPNFDAAPAYVNAVFLPMIFISGTFYSTSSLPGVLDAAARALPLKHVIDGLRAAIVTGSGLGHHIGALGALVAWSAGGIFLAVRFFRWE